MDWNSITHGLSSAGNFIKKKAEGAVDGVVHEAAKLGADVASFQPLENIAPTFADKLDHFFLSHTGQDFPRTVSAPKPSKHQALTPGVPAQVLGATKLDATQPMTTFGVKVDQSGEARLDLKASGPGTDWGKKGAESAVMSVYVDGKYQQDVVMWGGDKPTDYGVSLGGLSAGEHTVTLRYAREKSTKGASGVSIEQASAAVPTYKTPEDRWAAENAPILLGRHGSLENNHTDTPLGMYHKAEKNADGTTTISYGYAFSNEDGGTATEPTVEQARWGRLTDLETVFKVTVDADGKPVSRTYEGAGHHWEDFEGKMDGSHPIIRTATDNNNVTDQGGAMLRFQLPTDNPLGDFSTEELMRRNPSWFRAQSEEVTREGKVGPDGGTSTGSSNGVEKVAGKLGLTGIQPVADPRRYMYVQLDAQGAAADPVTTIVKLKDGTEHRSDLGSEALAIARDGWAQTSVLLPEGASLDDVAEVRFESKGQSKVERVGHAFMLSDGYDPQELDKGKVRKD